MDDFSKKIYSLGKIYGIMANVLPDVLKSPSRIANATVNPMDAITEGILLLHQNKKMNKYVDDEISILFNELDVEEMSKFKNLSTTQQGPWWFGYYAAKSQK